MIRPLREPALKRPSLAQQNTDFTAEGSPPPGKVAGSPPVTARPPVGNHGPRGRKLWPAPGKR